MKLIQRCLHCRRLSVISSCLIAGRAPRPSSAITPSRHIHIYKECHQAVGNSKSKEREKRNTFKWFGIPLGLGITCIAALHLWRVLQRERRSTDSVTWQLAAFRLLPARSLSRVWGSLAERELPMWARRPLLGLYVKMFGCNMAEAVEEDLKKYPSLLHLFCRQLKTDARPVDQDYDLVSPSDGKVLHMGRVEDDGRLEQIKGVSYSLHHFLGPSHETVSGGSNGEAGCYGDLQAAQGNNGIVKRCLYHVVIYLAPGDYHHFHSPADFAVQLRRHFPGELLTVAPWAAKTMPGLFTLNERVILSGLWRHGFFGMAAVGAYNVGSIKIALDQDILTNVKGKYTMGEYHDKKMVVDVMKGERVGNFSLGSTIVLIFEAPEHFHFLVSPGESVKYGQPLGIIHRVQSD